MTQSPYQNLPDAAFWRSGVAEVSPMSLEGLYTKKWPIRPRWKIGTAGSCFAQHISRNLRKNGYNVVDVEPAPKGLPADLHNKFGYSMYSARYGNIYTVRQLLQLVKEVAGTYEPADVVWEADGKYFDALRPGVEPEGLESPDEVWEHRAHHLAKVKQMLQRLDVFVFTLGLTEAWVHKPSGTVFPTAPGTIAGEFDDEKYAFKNFGFSEIVRDFNELQETLKTLREKTDLRFILTVSPVPLTATASGKHVLQASTYSKSVLRAVAGLLTDNHPYIDYFPSYEIITNQTARGMFFEGNFRSIASQGVEVVMRSFFLEHPMVQRSQDDSPAPDGVQSDRRGRTPTSAEDTQCEDAMLEAFLP